MVHISTSRSVVQTCSCVLVRFNAAHVLTPTQNTNETETHALVTTFLYTRDQKLYMGTFKQVVKRTRFCA